MRNVILTAVAASLMMATGAASAENHHKHGQRAHILVKSKVERQCKVVPQDRFEKVWVEFKEFHETSSHKKEIVVKCNGLDRDGVRVTPSSHHEHHDGHFSLLRDGIFRGHDNMLKAGIWADVDGKSGDSHWECGEGRQFHGDNRHAIMKIKYKVKIKAQRAPRAGHYYAPVTFSLDY